MRHQDAADIPGATRDENSLHAVIHLLRCDHEL
jgi:hypothetical protein